MEGDCLHQGAISLQINHGKPRTQLGPHGGQTGTKLLLEAGRVQALANSSNNRALDFRTSGSSGISSGGARGTQE
eukprot:5513295-Pyramimonas_sp.AAC.1